jgi:hypothetical protein
MSNILLNIKIILQFTNQSKALIDVLCFFEKICIDLPLKKVKEI